jgi:hypothetical protein
MVILIIFLAAPVQLLAARIGRGEKKPGTLAEPGSFHSSVAWSKRDVPRHREPFLEKNNQSYLMAESAHSQPFLKSHIEVSRDP